MSPMSYQLLYPAMLLVEPGGSSPPFSDTIRCNTPGIVRALFRIRLDSSIVHSFCPPEEGP